jgi:putative membrane protein
MGFGFLIARFALFLREYGITSGPSAAPQPKLSSWLGFVMVSVGVIVCVIAATRHRAYIQALERGVGNPPQDVRTTLSIAVVLAMVGLAIAIHIIML